MKTKRIIALLLALMLVFSVAAVLSACGEEDPATCTEHTDANNDKKCDNCGAEVALNDPTDDPTDDPTTDDPTTDDPTTDDPTTDDPTTDDPTTDDPTTDDPTTDDPTTDDPTTDDPTTDDPTTDDPTTDDPTTDDPTTDDPTKDDPTTEDPVIPTQALLVKDGAALFKFVVADGYTSELNSTVGKLVSDLAALNANTEILFDNADTVTSCEVLIGTVQSRGEQYKLDPHVYGYEGYAIKVIDGKVLIIGGSEDALVDAIAEFKKEILGIKKSTKQLSDVTMTEEQNIEIIQDNYNVESITVAGNDFRDFVIEAEASIVAEINAAKSVQEFLYKKTGMWLSIVEPGVEYANAIIFNLTDARTCKIENGFEARVTDGNIVIDCGFANKIEEATLAFIMTEITNSKNANVSFNNGYTYNKVDYRNIYYKDFGAVGNGYTDDFFAIKACHDQANEFGHTVNATSGATYYFGEGSGYETIRIHTDTNWKGCKFIFDDSTILSPRDDDGNWRQNDPEYETSIFTIDSVGEFNAYSAEDNNLPFTSLKEGYTNIGFAPGYRAMIVPYDTNVRHFIRYGGNQDNGASQTEIIMVDADGTIDPMTPVQWDYATVTNVYVYQLDDAPITISGGDGDKQTHIETIFNGAPSYYTYYKRNINITRPNVTIKNIKHTITGEDESPTGAPYNGFISISNTENVTVEGCEFQCPKTYYTLGTGGGSVNMGTYEINATSSNNITWKDCTQSNFFEPDGSLIFKGMMGTNYCKNLNFDNVFMCSFDAHKGTYNATLKNATCEHINFIGEGTIILENVTIHANASKCGLNFRNDYGATWQGDIKVNGLDLKYYNVNFLEFGRTQWVNHFFGYTTYLPENIWLENVTTTKISWQMVGDERIEKVESTNAMPLHLFYYLESYTYYDISDPKEDLAKNPTNDVIACICTAGFVDSDSNGLCDSCELPKVGDYSVNRNPYVPTKNVYIKNCPGLTLIIPNTPQFEDTKVYVYTEIDADEDGYGDGEYEYIEYDWKNNSGNVKIPQ